jgi:hypothetical protein
MEQQKSIGGLWIKNSKNNIQYMSGQIEINGQKINIACFANKKTKDTQPDFRIIISERQGGQIYQQPQAQQYQQSNRIVPQAPVDPETQLQNEINILQAQYQDLMKTPNGTAMFFDSLSAITTAISDKKKLLAQMAQKPTNNATDEINIEDIPF